MISTVDEDAFDWLSDFVQPVKPKLPVIDQKPDTSDRRPGSFVTDELGRIIVSYSSMKMFRACRRKYFNRYIRWLTLNYMRPADPRNIGTCAHGAVEYFMDDQEPNPLGKAADYIERFWGDVSRDHEAYEWKMRSFAAFAEYNRRWDSDEAQAENNWELVLREQKFTGDITNPQTGEVSAKYSIGGKIDGCVRVLRNCKWGITDLTPGGLYLVEHKTASSITGNYLARLYTDMQILLYSHYISDALQEPIEGVLYNVIGKSRLPHQEAETPFKFTKRKNEARELALKGELPVVGIRQRKAQGETPEQFKQRRVEAGLKKVDELVPLEREADEAYALRLVESYANPAMMHREVIEIDPRATTDVLSELWELLEIHDETMKRGRWGKNEDMCHAFFRWCDFWKLCSSFDSEHVLNENYVLREPHDEQSQEEDQNLPSQV